MSPGEVQEYEKEGLLKLHLEMRRFDEAAKEPNLGEGAMGSREKYLFMIEELLDVEKGKS